MSGGQRSLLCFYQMGLRDRAQVVRLGGWHLCSLSHLTSPGEQMYGCEWPTMPTPPPPPHPGSATLSPGAPKAGVLSEATAARRLVGNHVNQVEQQAGPSSPEKRASLCLGGWRGFI